MLSMNCARVLPGSGTSCVSCRLVCVKTGVRPSVSRPSKNTGRLLCMLVTRLIGMPLAARKASPDAGAGRELVVAVQLELVRPVRVQLAEQRLSVAVERHDQAVEQAG